MPIIYTNKFKSMILLKEKYNSIKAKKNHVYKYGNQDIS